MSTRPEWPITFFDEDYLKIYVEYSNEVWNGQFKQSKYAGEQGQKLGFGEKPWEAAWHYTAYRSVEIFRIWEDVFGGRERLVREQCRGQATRVGDEFRAALLGRVTITEQQQVHLVPR